MEAVLYCAPCLCCPCTRALPTSPTCLCLLQTWISSFAPVACATSFSPASPRTVRAAMLCHALPRFYTHLVPACIVRILPPLSPTPLDSTAPAYSLACPPSCFLPTTRTLPARSLQQTRTNPPAQLSLTYLVVCCALQFACTPLCGMQTTWDTSACCCLTVWG